MTVNDLTVLASEGPILRAYLTFLRRSAVRVPRIIMMVPRQHPTTGNAIAQWLPSAVRTAYIERLQDGWHHHWPRRLCKTHGELVSGLKRRLAEHFDFSVSVFDEMYGPPDLERYAKQVDRILVDSLSDPELAIRLSDLDTKEIIFTGGGIVPESLLSASGCRFFHIHPGHLPDVRGADGLLWSTLVRGRPGASLLILNAGIDAGDVIDTREFAPFGYAISDQERPDDDTLYRILFSFYDPVMRAVMLEDVLRRFDSAGDLPSTPQQTELGLTYHFMSRRLRRAGLRLIFPDRT